jgi:hypothetical protein
MKWLITLLAVACSSQPPSEQLSADLVHQQDSQFLTLVPMIVDTAECYARAAGREHARGPLIVNMESFITAARTGIADSLSRVQIRQAIGRGFADLPVEQSQECTPDDECRIVNNGVYVRLDSVARTMSGFDAVVTFDWTSPRGGAIDVNTYRFVFRRGRTGWLLTHKKALAQT